MVPQLFPEYFFPKKLEKMYGNSERKFGKLSGNRHLYKEVRQVLFKIRKLRYVTKVSCCPCKITFRSSLHVIQTIQLSPADHVIQVVVKFGPVMLSVVVFCVVPIIADKPSDDKSRIWCIIRIQLVIVFEFSMTDELNKCKHNN